PQFTPAPLRKLARATGGKYYGVHSTAALAGVYDTIAGRLKRTWALEYSTTARPGDHVELLARAGGAAGTATVTIAGDPGNGSGGPSFLPAAFFQSTVGGLVLAFIVGS